MRKRVLAILMAALLLLSLATACQNTGSQSSTDSPAASGETGKVDLSQKREVKVTIQTNTFITSYDDNDLTKQLEEDLNCNITFDLLPAGTDALSKLQLMINGGNELSDIISYSLSSALTYQYGSNGTFIALNDYFDNKDIMPYFNAIESEDDKASMMGNLMSADGNIYTLAQYNPSTWNLTPYRIYMNMNWLDNLNLEVPTTSEELKDVLVKFANDDPNGNGVKDEIPLFAQYSDGGYGNNVILALINMFQPTGKSMSGLTLTEDGKTVIAPQTTDAWKEAMKYLSTLTKEGAILPEASFAYDSTSYNGTLNYQGIGTEKAEPGKSINIVGMFTAGSNTGTFANSGTDGNVNYLEYEMIPVPTGPDGAAYTPYESYSPASYWYVTSHAKDPDFCVMMGDWFYEPDHSTWARFGIEGVDWTKDKEFCADWYAEHTKLIEEAGYEQTIDGYYSMVRLRADALWGENNAAFWHDQQPRYISLEDFVHLANYSDPETFVYYRGDSVRLIGISQEYYGDAHPQYLLPALSYTDEEQASITETQVAYPDVVTEWVMKFITGEADPEADWQAYLDALNGTGLQDYLKVAQAAYERTTYYQANF